MACTVLDGAGGSNPYSERGGKHRVPDGRDHPGPALLSGWDGAGLWKGIKTVEP